MSDTIRLKTDEMAGGESGKAGDMVAGVRFHPVGKIYHFDYSALPGLEVGDYVIVETSRGRHIGRVIEFAEPEPDREYKPILRIATPRDMLIYQTWKAREPQVLETSRRRAIELGYRNIKLIRAEYNFDGSVLTIYYGTVGDERVDISRLKTALRRKFRTKIDMRHVGPRDMARLLGGLGACGEPVCCGTFLSDFCPISIRMAKTQGISLNPSEITGMCGRLRCCLHYEVEQYEEASKDMPPKGKRVGTPHGVGKVVDVYPLQGTVSVLVGEVRYTLPKEALTEPDIET